MYHIINAQLRCFGLGINHLIGKKILGYLPDETKAPIVLDSYANTSSAGSIIAMHLHRAHLQSGDFAVLCSFGAGYSAGAILLKKG